MAAAKKEAIDTDRLKIVLEAWKHAVTVQMHFNDTEMKVRNLYFTILAASLGLVGVAQGKWVQLSVFQMSVSMALLVVLAMIPITLLFYFIDRHWYHRLLQGSVLHCIEIEKMYGDDLPEIKMGAQISKSSPVEFKARIWKLLFFFVRDRRFREGSMLHSDQKIQVVYLSVVWAALIIVLFFGFFSGVKVHNVTLAELVFQSKQSDQPIPGGIPTNFQTETPNSPSKTTP